MAKSQTVTGAKVGTPVQYTPDGAPKGFVIPAQIYQIEGDGTVSLVVFSRQTGVEFIDGVSQGDEPGQFALI